MTNQKLWRVGIHTILVVAASLAATATSCGRVAQVGEVKPGQDWIDDMRGKIREQLTNRDTAEQLLAEVDRLEEMVLAFDAATIDSYNRLKEDFNTVRIQHRNTVMDVRFRMRELTTPEDWETLSDIDETLLSQWERQFEL